MLYLLDERIIVLDLMDTSDNVIVEGAFSNNTNFLTLLAC